MSVDGGDSMRSVQVERKDETTPLMSGDRAESEPAVVEPDGEALFEKACVLQHMPIPDFVLDRRYLELLVRSAAVGYAPAMVKLGEYAMRRAMWVEAYYWMTLAKRRKMQNLTAVMRGIRMNWIKAGFPNETWNVNPLFGNTAGSIGRALLHIDTGRGAVNARAFLQKNHPEYLPD